MFFYPRQQKLRVMTPERISAAIFIRFSRLRGIEGGCVACGKRCSKEAALRRRMASVSYHAPLSSPGCGGPRALSVILQRLCPYRAKELPNAFAHLF
jgi:hypothetical protein